MLIYKSTIKWVYVRKFLVVQFVTYFQLVLLKLIQNTRSLDCLRFSIKVHKSCQFHACRLIISFLLPLPHLLSTQQPFPPPRLFLIYSPLREVTIQVVGKLPWLRSFLAHVSFSEKVSDTCGHLLAFVSKIILRSDSIIYTCTYWVHFLHKVHYWLFNGQFAHTFVVL